MKTKQIKLQCARARAWPRPSGETAAATQPALTNTTTYKTSCSEPCLDPCLEPPPQLDLSPHIPSLHRTCCVGGDPPLLPCVWSGEEGRPRAHARDPARSPAHDEDGPLSMRDLRGARPVLVMRRGSGVTLYEATPPRPTPPLPPLCAPPPTPIWRVIHFSTLPKSILAHLALPCSLDQFAVPGAAHPYFMSPPSLIQCSTLLNCLIDRITPRCRPFMAGRAFLGGRPTAGLQRSRLELWS